MATVNVDLSEYDMLRQAKNKAEKEVEELKETIKGLESKSRVIIRSVPANLSAEDVINNFNILRSSNYMGGYSGTRELLKMSIERALRSKVVSSQYINFDDIKLSIEEKIDKEYRESMDASKRSYDIAATSYYNKEKSLEKDFEEKYKNKLKEKDNEIVNLNVKLEEAKSKIEELRSSFSVRQEEAAKALKEAQDKYDELMGESNKSWFQKLFK